GFDDYARVTGKPLTVPPQHSPNHWSVAWRPSIMKQKPYSRRKRTTTKSVLRLPDLEHAKVAVLNSLTSLDAQRGYRHAIDEFVDWYCSEPRLALNRIVVLRYRSHLESRQLAPGTVNLRLGAVRRLALGSAMLREASWSRSNFFWGTFRCKRPNATLGANSGFDQPSMIALASSRILELGARLWKGCRQSANRCKLWRL